MNLEYALQVLLELFYIVMGGLMFDLTITSLKRDKTIWAGMGFMFMFWYLFRLFWMNVGL